VEEYSIRELAEMMLRIAQEYPAYSKASQIKIVEKSSAEFYGAGYQDVQSRVPDISHTQNELGWNPTVNLETALRNIFEFYSERAIELQELTQE
jgi:nucleoside-diphosphate-sugar epimerase